jgi:hypothetical protein
VLATRHAAKDALKTAHTKPMNREKLKAAQANLSGRGISLELGI